MWKKKKSKKSHSMYNWKGYKKWWLLFVLLPLSSWARNRIVCLAFRLLKSRLLDCICVCPILIAILSKFGRPIIVFIFVFSLLFIFLILFFLLIILIFFLFAIFPFEHWCISLSKWVVFLFESLLLHKM